MQTEPYLTRARPLISRGMQIGTRLGFFSSLLYTVMLFILLSPTAIIGIFTIPLSATIGMVVGFLIASILAILPTRIGDVWASLIGFVVGSIVIFIIHYCIWLTPYAGFYENVPFATYLLPFKENLFELLIYPNPFFIPSIIAVLLLTWGAWRINKESPFERKIDWPRNDSF